MAVVYLNVALVTLIPTPSVHVYFRSSIFRIFRFELILSSFLPMNFRNVKRDESKKKDGWKKKEKKKKDKGKMIVEIR